MRKRIRDFLVSTARVITKPFSKLLEFFKRKPRAAQATAAVVTPGICMVITAFIFGWVPSTLMMVQIIVHEYAHYFVARIVEVKDVWLPFFIPLVIGAHAKTYVDTDDPAKQRKIALAGPIAGIVLAVIWVVAGFLSGAPILIAAGVIFGIVEIINAVFGDDGKKFRIAGRQMKSRREEEVIMNAAGI